MLDEARSFGAGRSDLVEFRRAGDAEPGEYLCAECGYGVSVQTTLPRCPMCQGENWELIAFRAAERARPLH